MAVKKITFTSHQDAIRAFLLEPAEAKAIVPNAKWVEELDRLSLDRIDPRAPLKSTQMLGASKRATGAYTEVREDCEFVGNDAGGCFLEVPSRSIIGRRVFTLPDYLKAHTKHISPVISRGTKRAIIYQTLRSAKLNYFKTVSMGVVNTFVTAISLLKKNRISVSELTNILSTRGSLKEADLLKVYEDYEEELRRRGLHDEESLFALPVTQSASVPFLLGFINTPDVSFDAIYCHVEPKTGKTPKVFALNSPFDEARFIANKVASALNDGLSPEKILVYNTDGFAWEVIRECSSIELPFKISASGIVRRIFNCELPEEAPVKEYTKLISEILHDEYDKISIDKHPTFSARSLSYLDSINKILKRIIFENENTTEAIQKDEFFLIFHQEINSIKLSLPKKLPCRFVPFENAGLYESDLSIIPQMFDGQEIAISPHSIFFTEADTLSPSPDKRIEQIFPSPVDTIKTSIKILGLAVCENTMITFPLHTETGSDIAGTPLIMKWPAESVTIATNEISAISCDDTCGTNFKTPEALNELKNFMKDKRHSATKLEEYGNCPFAYFGRYVLGIEPPEEITPEVQPRDRGTLIHDSLEHFFIKYRNTWNNSTEKIDELVAEIVNEVFERRRDITKKYHNDMVHYCKRRTISFVTAVVLSEIDYMKEATQKPAHFELAFDDILKDDILIKGKIDRIDMDDSTFTVIDYKNGKIDSVKSGIKKGTELQMPIYTEMARRILKKEPAAAFLYSIKKQIRQSGIVKKELREHVMGKKASKLSVAENEFNELIQLGIDTACKYVEKIRSGQFEGSPQKCESYCDWKDACRCRSV